MEGRRGGHVQYKLSLLEALVLVGSSSALRS